MTIDLSFDDRYVNLVEQGVDLAIRMGRLADSTLGARYLGANPWVMVAAPAYLAAHGTPSMPADLAQHACLVYSSVQGDDRWTLHRPRRQASRSVPVRGPLRSNNLSAVLAAARAGLGLAILPWYVARESVADGSVQPVLDRPRAAGAGDPRRVPVAEAGAVEGDDFIDHLQQALAGDWWSRRA